MTESGGGREDRSLALGEIAWDVIARVVRERLARKPGGHLVEPGLEEIELALRLSLSEGEGGAREFAQRLVESVDAILDDLVQQAAAFRPGRAFCHRCSNAGCEHAQPPSARHVFVGYGPTGTPRWEDFAQYCLDLRHAEVDRLYDDPPAFVTLVHDPASLRGAMVPAFEAGGYELLGQLTAGFFTVRARAEEGRGVVAIAFQVAASKRATGRPRLGLNLLGRTPSGEELGMLWERQDDLPWRLAVRWAQSALVSLSAAASGGGRGRASRRAISVEERALRVDGILRGMARRLERDVRGRSRRTGHAQARHDSGERPTRMAVTDARGVREEAVLVDERNGTLVVLGERGRTHFFTPEGRLVSSVRYSREAIERKRKLGVWRDASADEAAALRGRLAGRDPGPRL